MKERSLAGMRELDDARLASVVGGSRYVTANGRLYRYAGGVSDEDLGRCYLCPNCGRPVSYGSWLRFHCRHCDKSWYSGDGLAPNWESGVWQEVPSSGE